MMAFIKKESGESLLSLMVGLSLGLIVLGTAFTSFLDSSWRSIDADIIAKTDERARALLDLIVFDLRMMGSGMPLGQPGFVIGGAGMGTAPYPILTTSNATTISFRMNETGTSAVLTANYLPSVGNLTFSVNSAADIEAGDTIYMSNMPVGGLAGLMGVVTGVAGNQVTINAGYTATAATTFNAGSSIARVTNVVFNSPVNGSGVTRNAENGAVLLAPRSTFSLEYLDNNANPLALPLTAANITVDLAAVRVTATLTSEVKLHKGDYYYASQAVETVALRNLNLNR